MNGVGLFSLHLQELQLIRMELVEGPACFVTALNAGDVAVDAVANALTPMSTVI